MKIVHYLSSVTRSAGGLYYSVSGLSKAQAAQGHDITIIGGADKHAPDDLRMWAGLKLRTHPYTSHGYGFNLRVPGMITAVRPDILHIHGIWSAASIYGLLASRRGIATVVSPRGMLDPWILKRSASVKFLHALAFERPLLRHGLAHALCESERDSIVRFMRSDQSQIVVVPNGVSLRPVNEAAPRVGALYLGRLHEKKQVLELIDAWGATASTRSIPLKIAGWGTPDYEARVSRACMRSPNVEFVGSAYGEKKEHLLATTAFFILPSLSEGLPMAVLEAMAAGAIPIITAECNLPELFEQAAAIEMRADFGDFEALVVRAGGFTSDELAALRRKVATAITAFGWDSLATKMIDQYRALLNGTAGAAPAASHLTGYKR